MKALVLAAGKGERLRPLTDNTPKPLLRLNSKPLIEYVFDQLQVAGFKEVVVNAWYLKDKILAYCDEVKSRYSFKIQVSEEEVLLGTGGGLKQALNFLGDTPFLILNADCLWAGDLKAFVESSKKMKAEATWLLTDARVEQTQVGLKGDRICKIGSLWNFEEPDADYCFSGIQWVQSIERAELPDEGCLIRQYFLPRLRKSPHILAGTVGFLSSWEDLGTPERFKSFERPH